MGILYIVSTPIGNLDDMTIRGVKTLLTVDIIACEDTRRTGLLLQNLPDFPHSPHSPDIKKPHLIPYHDHNEEQKTPELIQFLRAGKSIALVSDAGTPTIADPGYRLIHACIKEGIGIIPIPGPSAAITALSVSGLATNAFLFLGYLPKKSASRQQTLHSMFQCFKSLEHEERSPQIQTGVRHPASLKNIKRRGHPTIILYEAPHRLIETLTDIQTVFGDIHIVVAKELTKIHEEIWRGTISDALTHFPTPKGEYVVLF